VDMHNDVIGHWPEKALDELLKEIFPRRKFADLDERVARTEGTYYIVIGEGVAVPVHRDMAHDFYLTLCEDLGDLEFVWDEAWSSSIGLDLDHKGTGIMLSIGGIPMIFGV